LGWGHGLHFKEKKTALTWKHFHDQFGLGLGTWATFQGKKNGTDISMISLVLGEPAPTTMGKTLTFLGLFLNNINTSVACAFAHM